MKKGKNSKHLRLRDCVENGVCFICTANMGRSAMAEAIARNLEPGIEFTSCGLRTLNGYPATKEAKSAIASRGISLESHISKLVSKDLIDGKLVICMTEKHKQILLRDYPENEIYLLTELGSGTRKDIPDPVGKDIDKHLESLNFLEVEINFLLSNLKA